MMENPSSGGRHGLHIPRHGQRLRHPGARRQVQPAGINCIKIGLPGKLILSKRKGLWEVLFS